MIPEQYQLDRYTDPMAHVYDLLEDQFDVELEAYPYEISTKFGLTIPVRNADGSWVDFLQGFSPGSPNWTIPWATWTTKHPLIEWCARTFTIHRIRTRISMRSAQETLLALSELDISPSASKQDFSEKLTIWFLDMHRRCAASANDKLIGGIRAFYEFFLSEDVFGFNDEAMLEANKIVVKPNKHQALAVTLRCPYYGPYDVVEMQRIMQEAEISSRVSHQDRALLLLCRDWGLRPIQIALLIEADLTKDGSGYSLKVPGVKGQRRSALRRHPSNLKDRPLPEETGAALSRLIEINKERTDSAVRAASEETGLPQSAFTRPMFPASYPRRYALTWNSKIPEFCLHNRSLTISRRIRDLTEKLSISNLRATIDEDGESEDAIVEISASRFRRTRGTMMALSGFSIEEVAEALDHEDIGSVKYYFRSSPDMVTAINGMYNKSSLLKGAVEYWAGRFSPTDHSESPGKPIKSFTLSSLGLCMRDSLCPFHPTVTCYACSHFRPNRAGDHRAALQDIERLRSTLDSSASGPVVRQLDAAVLGAQAICELSESADE